MPHIIPIRDLKDTAAISQMCNESNEPIYITKNGYGDMVIMSMEAYERSMYLNGIYSRLERSEKQMEEGRSEDGFEQIQRMKEKYGL